jgi:D-alanine-D-alanine ligase
LQEIDVIFPAFHGGLGENGGFPGIFEAMDLPYVGPGITGGALGMDKIVMKMLFQQADIPVTRWQWFYRSAWEKDPSALVTKIEKELKYPFFVKPATGGSSIGTTKAHNKKELENAIEVAAVFDSRIIVEESFENAREINVSVLGNAGSDLMVSVCEEVFAAGEVLTFEDKYVGNSKGGAKGMAQTKRQIPADIPKDIEKKIQTTAKKVFDTLLGSGVCRIDFLYKEKTQEIKVIEENTIPGSLSFYLWEASGLSFKDMNTKLIALAIERYEDTQKNVTTFSSNILKDFNASGKGKA